MVPEKARLKLGIIPLIDCAPIVIAKERGFFSELGLEVELSREASWASIRDKVAVGALDGAHMLAPMPLAMTVGASPLRVPMVTGMALGLGGNTIAVATGLWARMVAADPNAGQSAAASARALKAVVDEDKAHGRPPMTFATVYPYSPHTYDLRWWLTEAGINPDRDIRLVVVPPAQMVARLSGGGIVGFCVGEPWGSLSARMGLGRVVATGRDIFGGRIEKVFAVTQAWAAAHPATHIALVQALTAAAAWCDENRVETAELLCQPHYLNAPFEAVAAPLMGEEGLPADLFVFHRWAANFPWRSQALWYLRQMARWGELPAGTDPRQAAADVFKPDIFRQAAGRLGLAVPTIDDKTEGTHAQPWQLTQATQPIEMGPDLLMGGAIFDPRALPADATNSAQTTEFNA